MDTVKRVLQIGNPILRLRAVQVDFPVRPETEQEMKDLIKTLEWFRAEYGFGRAVAAPQIGVSKRFIAFNFEGESFLMMNPEIIYRSDDTFTMWDDCMSFPSLLVKLRRHSSISVKYQNEEGKVVTLENLNLSLSELIQHEVDHLDGILAIDRQIDKDSIIARIEYENNPEYFNKMVDHRSQIYSGI